MASSRKRRQNPDRFEAALDAALDRVFDRTGASPPAALGVAYSGGADSSLLIATCASVARRRGMRAVGLHVHHGLSPFANDWAEFCRATCEELGLEFRQIRVEVARRGGESLEANARDERYAALATLCAALDLSVLVTGHHRADQAETVLLNLARGGGLAGLQGIAEERHLGTTWLVRPFLSFSAREIRDQLRERGRAWIEDESNDDERLRRNAIRHRILPALESIAPGSTDHLARVAQFATQAQSLLDERGLDDLRALQASETGFAVAGLALLSPARSTNAVRTWFRQFRDRAPSEAFVQDFLRQLATGGPGARTELRHGHERFVVLKGRLTAIALADPGKPPPPVMLRWSGESTLDLPGWGGRLHFEAESPLGVSSDWLRSVTLTVCARTGGERLRLAHGRPSRSLKNLYQESEIPAHERSDLPLVYANDTLLWAAGLGADVRMLAATDQRKVAMRWERKKDV